MKACMVLIHSPLVGPFTWQLVGEEFRRQGEQAILPDISGALRQPPPYYRSIAAEVRQALAPLSPDDPVILAGHSGAGPLLPAVRERLEQPVAGYVFVDAGLPLHGASFFDRAPAALTGPLRESAKDGWLPPWADWFGEDIIRQVLPDARLLERFLAELQPVPLALLEEGPPVFPGWPDAPCGYIQFSPGYDPDAGMARQFGWPVLHLQAAHLHMLVDPGEVAEAIRMMANTLTLWV